MYLLLWPWRKDSELTRRKELKCNIYIFISLRNDKIKMLSGALPESSKFSAHLSINKQFQPQVPHNLQIPSYEVEMEGQAV